MASKTKLSKKVTLSEMEQLVREANLIDAQNKMIMADHILVFFKMPLTCKIVTPGLLGINSFHYEDLMDKIKIGKSGSFKILNDDVVSMLGGTDNHFTYMDVRELLLEYYIEKRDIPTREKIRARLENRELLCNDIRVDYFLKLHGFIWIKLPGTKKCILIEHPKKVLERYKYFKRLTQYRNDRRPIVYIEAKHFSNETFDANPNKLKYGKSAAIVVVTENALIQTHIYTYPADSLLYNWINYELMPMLPKHSLIVIEDRFNCEIDNHRYPSDVNSKEVMKAWLNDHDIIYEDNMNKADLMTLVNKFTEERTMILDDILKMQGHEVVRRQKDLPNLSVIGPVAECIQKSWKVRKNDIDGSRRASKHILDVFHGCTEEQWKQMFAKVKAEEKKILNEDIILDEVINNIISVTSHEGLDDDYDLSDYLPDIEDYVLEIKDLEKNKRLKNTYSLKI